MDVKQFYVAVFSYELDQYKKLSNSMSIESCRGFIKSKREDSNEYFVIIAVLDE